MGLMTNHFFPARGGLPLKLRNEPKTSNPGVPEWGRFPTCPLNCRLPSWCPPVGQMTYCFLARGGPPLNPCQKLRNEPKTSNPGVPQTTVSRISEIVLVSILEPHRELMRHN
jgi:hypothetical protein